MTTIILTYFSTVEAMFYYIMGYILVVLLFLLVCCFKNRRIQRRLFGNRMWFHSHETPTNLETWYISPS